MRKNVISILIVLITSFIAVTIALCASDASAVNYQNNTNVEFTFNPTLSLTISDNLVIDNLSPGTYSDSNIITVSAETNNVTGYTLTASVGNGTTYANNSLVGAGGDFASLATSGDGIVSMESAEPNTWGYSYSLDGGNNWNRYFGLPYYDDGAKTLVDTNANGSSNLKFKIAAKSGTTQAAGTYSNVVNFMMTAYPEDALNSIERIRDELAKTSYARLSTNVGDQMYFKSSYVADPRYCTRTTDEPVIFINSYGNENWRGYGVITLSNPFLCDYNTYGSVSLIDPSKQPFSTSNGTAYYTMRMGSQFSTDEPTYTINGVSGIKLSLSDDDPHINNTSGTSGIIGDNPALISELEEYIDALYQVVNSGN